MRKRFLIPLLAALALPTASYAGNVYLLVRDGYLATPGFAVMPMENMEQCEEAGALYVSSERLYRSNERRGFECFFGK